jgi:hypothetical protein
MHEVSKPLGDDPPTNGSVPIHARVPPRCA